MEGYDCSSSGVSFLGHSDCAMRSLEQVFIVLVTGLEQRAGQEGAGGDPCQVWAGTAEVVGTHR